MKEEIKEYKWLIVENDQFVQNITLNRPEVGNAMNEEMALELIYLFQQTAKNKSINAIILRGAGKHFSAGGDLKDMQENIEITDSQKEDPLYRINRRFGHLLTLVDKMPQVVISVVNGAARGGGLGLVCVSDLVIGTKISSFAMPETGFGLPGAQIIPFVCQRLGKPIARQLITTGEVINGTKAHEIGLVTHLSLDINSAEEALKQLLEEIKKRSPSAIMQSKELIDKVGKQPLSVILDDGAKIVAEMSRKGDGYEGLNAFLEKRKPKWVHR